MHGNNLNHQFDLILHYLLVKKNGDNILSIHT